VTRRRLTAVIVATRGGDPLAAALADAGWADARVVLDVVGRVGAAGDAPVLRRAAELRELDSWLVLLDESERLGARDALALRAAVDAAGPRDGLWVRIVSDGLALRVATGRSVRVAPPGARVVLGRGMRLELGGAALRRVGSEIVVTRARGAAVGDAVAQLDAEAAVLARLAEGDGPTIGGVLWEPLAAALATAWGRSGGGPLGLGRWVLAVLDGYRVVVAQAKRWELRRDRPIELA
jgi:hypothetical protein